MKKLIAAVLLASVATAAFAADLPSRKAAPVPAPVYVPPAFTWTGLYVGINGGYGWSNFRGAGGNVFADPSGGMIGGTVGYNYQIGQFVVGLEDNLDWTDLSNSRTLTGGVSTKSRVNAFNTAFARAGVAFDRALFFAEGGLSSGDVKNQVTDPKLPGTISQSGWENGYGIGGGVEYAFTNNISARADYVFSHLQDKTYFAGTPDVVKAGLNVSQIRGGLNYKF